MVIYYHIFKHDTTVAQTFSTLYRVDKVTVISLMLKVLYIISICKTYSIVTTKQVFKIINITIWALWTYLAVKVETIQTLHSHIMLLVLWFIEWSQLKQQ